MRPGTRRPTRGFTMIELMVVMLIISILLGFILAASAGAVREAERQATIATIAKIEAALNDRVEALLAQRVDPIDAHYFMAMPYGAGNVALYQLPLGSMAPPPYTISQLDRSKIQQRAQVIALFDLMKAELPDVFFVMQSTPAGANFPINFGSHAFPINTSNINDPRNYFLPLGVAGNSTTISPTGIYGASFTAYQAVTKNATNLANHRHKTARAEALYALLIEAKSPYGAAMTRDNFTSKEIGDTDNDGLPEILDAWGEPLYFYRWPILYHSDVQKGTDPATVAAGTGPYNSLFEQRELDPLDPNQYLLSVSWWSASTNAGPISPPMPTSGSTSPLSGPAFAFQQFFHALVEPMAQVNPTSSQGFYWDRGINPAFSARRAFFSRPLVLSSGPDRTLGLPVLDDVTLNTQISSGNDVASQAVGFEGQAGKFALGPRLQSPNVFGGPLTALPPDIYDAGNDDVGNQSLQATGGSSQ